MTSAISALPLIGKGPYRFGGPQPFPLTASGLSLWHNGRAAIWQAVRALGLRQGGRILAPAYCCGSEVDALIQAGLEPIFFRIGPDLRVDLDHLEMQCRQQPVAIYVIHFFGFPQPMDSILEIAGRHRIPVIEDCASSLYSCDERGVPLGSRSTAAIFSFPKFLPVPDGGAFVDNRSERGASRLASTMPGLRPVLGRLKYLMRERLRDGRPPMPTAGVAAAASAVAAKAFPAYARLNPARRDWRMSPIARGLLAITDHAAVAARRRHNFGRLAGALIDGPAARPLVARLPDGCCPWFFPLQVPRRLDLKHVLASRGIGTREIWDYRHPAIPAADFPLEHEFKDGVLALPIHQNLADRDIDRIAETVNEWNAAGR